MSPVLVTAPRALLFDLDGTLYHQSPVRRRMALELALLPLRSLSIATTRRTLRRISRFRKVREELRELGRPAESLDELQYTLPARQLGDDPEELRATIEDWMGKRPLPFVARHAREGLGAFLGGLGTRGVKVGVYSDFPVHEKLDVMGVLEHFSITLCSTDAEINAFKPHPRGFLNACELWDLAPMDVLYVGDRADVDARGAHAAGMSCALLGGTASGAETPTFASLAALERTLAALQ